MSTSPRSIWILLAAAACATGCKKKERAAVETRTAEEPAKAESVNAPEPDSPVPLKPLPPATDGPVYASVQYAGVLRLDPEGWKVIGKPADIVRIVLGADGALWAWNDSRVWKLDGDMFTKIPSSGTISDAAAASDGTLWTIADSQLRRYGSGSWTTDAVPGGDPPRGVSADSEGIWVHTLDRTYRRTGNTWLPFDVPGVTGQVADILSIASQGQAAYLATSLGVFTFEKAAWRLVRAHSTMGEYASVAVGPAGRFALTTRTEKFLGDSSIGGRGLRPIDIASLGTAADYVGLFATDDRGRTWGSAYTKLLVFDQDGKVIKRWTDHESPLFKGSVINVVVARGGPAGLDPGERTAGKVTGKVEGSAAGMTVRVCSQSRPEYNKEPCEGVANARNTSTNEGGTFTLDGVTIGPMYFWVKRGTRWRATSSSTPCCTQLTPDGTVDVGTLALQ